jgi:hypothetical protein
MQHPTYPRINVLLQAKKQPVQKNVNLSKNPWLVVTAVLISARSSEMTNSL